MAADPSNDVGEFDALLRYFNIDAFTTEDSEAASGPLDQSYTLVPYNTHEPPPAPQPSGLYTHPSETSLIPQFSHPTNMEATPTELLHRPPLQDIYAHSSMIEQPSTFQDAIYNSSIYPAWSEQTVLPIQPMYIDAPTSGLEQWNPTAENQPLPLYATGRHSFAHPMAFAANLETGVSHNDSMALIPIQDSHAFLGHDSFAPPFDAGYPVDLTNYPEPSDAIVALSSAPVHASILPNHTHPPSSHVSVVGDNFYQDPIPFLGPHGSGEVPMHIGSNRIPDRMTNIVMRTSQSVPRRKRKRPKSDDKPKQQLSAERQLSKRTGAPVDSLHVLDFVCRNQTHSDTGLFTKRSRTDDQKREKKDVEDKGGACLLCYRTKQKVSSSENQFHCRCKADLTIC
jgi:hypothetical protein